MEYLLTFMLFNDILFANKEDLLDQSVLNVSHQNIFTQGGVNVPPINSPNNGPTVWPPLLGRALEDQNGGADPPYQPSRPREGGGRGRL